MKLTMLITSPLLLLFCIGFDHASAWAVQGNSSDMHSLLDFKRAISGDPHRALSSWNTTTSLCQWNGVSCSWKHPGRVMALDLGGHGLSGSISPSLGNLTLLRELNLSSNTLSGQYPPLGRLRRLEALDLFNNSLHDRIPDALTNCTNLRTLDLSHNLIFGQIPPKVAPNIYYFFLDNNMFHGHIPASLGNASRLERIGLESNNFAGRIPSSLGKLPNLGSLYLAGNSIEASDQESWAFLYALANCTSSLCNNKSTNLQILSLGENRLSGRVLPIIQNIHGLFALGLEGNNLTGTIPSSIGNLTNLISLSLAENGFSGHIPSNLGNLQQLQDMNISHNNLEGGIPSNLGNLDQLKHLDLRSNMLQGIIP